MVPITDDEDWPTTSHHFSSSSLAKDTDNNMNINRVIYGTQNDKNMIEFKKYSSIENSFSREFMENVVAQVPPDME